MKKKLITLILAIISLSLLSAMPPHPRVIQEYKENDSLPLLSRQIAIDAQIGKNQAVKSFPSTGTQKVLVLLVGFNLDSMDIASTPGFYDGLFTNGPSGNGLSWKKYYEDMSNNNLMLEFDVFDVSDAIELHDYYGTNVSGIQGNDEHPGQLVAEAVKAGDDAGIDYALYDNDDDGYVDAVIVIHQGQGEEYSGSATDIWSHRWNLFSSNFYNNGGAGYNSYATDSDGDGILEYDNVLINDYAMQPEYLDSAGDSTIGVFVHEFGHILGLPDLYDTSYASDGIGQWAIMSGGSWLGPGWDGSQPAPMTAWSRAQLGWITVATANAENLYPFSGFINRYLPTILIILILFLSTLLISGKLENTKPKRFVLLTIIFFSLIPLSTCKKDSAASLVSIDLADIEISYKAKKININSNEYLLVENKIKKNDTWTEYLPGQGLVVYHIDNNLVAGRYAANTINDYSINGQLGIRLVEADSNNNLLDPDDGDEGSATDPFYFGNVDSITNYTANSGETANFEITNISGIGSVISFNVLSY